MNNLNIGDKVKMRTLDNRTYNGEITYILHKLQAIVLNNTDIIQMKNIKMLIKRG